MAIKFDIDLLIQSEANSLVKYIKDNEHAYRPGDTDGTFMQINKIKTQFQDKGERALFLHKVIEGTNTNFNGHLKHCDFKEDENFLKCVINKYYSRILQFLENELRNLNSNDYKLTRPNIYTDLVNKNLSDLKAYGEVLKIYTEAVDKLKLKKYDRNILDDLRLGLETLLKELLSNNKSLENQVSVLGIFLKNKNVSPHVITIYTTLITYFGKYQNEHIKHNDAVPASEVELIFNLTSTLINYLLMVK